ncbi:MAG: DUF3696 domain-containing protein, partial [Lentimicrobiaceae bacterium]|nr:DUF3696 domain-containing protein [Lentimicrobiaceae bacterium]
HFNGEKFALPQLGTGISQVLPILVMCLAAEPGSTIAIQEPEAHLHPKMQSRLADFFIAMSLSGRQCLIETHSEYMIEQLRYRVITQEETDKEKLHEKTKLYFVSKKEGVSQFKKIEMNSYAKLSEWPEDFFDESNKLADKITDEILRKLEGDDLDD